MTLLDRVANVLSQREIAHALIGAGALAVYGVSRSTLDHDLLVVDSRALDLDLWNQLQSDATIDIRRGDADDPLAGVVRITRDGDRDVDVVVGRDTWQRDVLARAVTVGAAGPRVVERADLVLMKLYAGGSQDRWDIEQLLALDSTNDVASAVSARIHVLPHHSRQLWADLRAAR